MNAFNNLSIEEIKADGYEVPEFVKLASDKEPTLYAFNDGISPKFPIDTPSNAWLSSVQFVKCASEVPAQYRDEIATRLSEAAEFHGLKFNRNIEKTASVDDEMVKLASEISSFEKRLNAWSPSQRRKIAKELKRRQEALEAAGSEPVKSDTVERYAGDNLAKDWREHLLDRLKLVAHRPEAKKDYHGLLNSAHDIEQHEKPEELAELVEHLDKKHNLEGHWDNSIRDPFFSMLGNHATPKVAIVIMRVNGKHFGPEAFANLDREKLSGKLSDDVVDEIFNNKDKSLEHLPAFVKNLLASLIHA